MGYEITVGLFFGGLFILTQRIVERRRAAFRAFVYFLIFLLFLRGNLVKENLIGLGIAAIASYLYWLLIGRYNEVLDDEETIKVFGMDD